MSFLEGIVEKVVTTCGMDPEDAEKLGDLVSCGANLAVGNYAGATANGLDLLELDDDVPWLAQGLEMAGGDPVAGGAPMAGMRPLAGEDPMAGGPGAPGPGDARLLVSFAFEV
jgi:hypothetical protein